MSILHTTQLTRRYGPRIGVEAINLQVDAGEIFGFLGPNGAGKTTTIRLLMGLLKPDAGSAQIMGVDCWAQSARAKQDIGYLPGDVRLYPWLSLRRAIPLVSRVRGENIGPYANQLAERLELEPTLPIRKMSRGTRQKLGLVLTMAHRPKLLILDEPTSALDPLVQQELSAIFREAVDDGGSVFFSSHTLSEVESLCHRIAIVRRGRIVIDQSLAALRNQAARQVELTFTDEALPASVILPSFLSEGQWDDGRWVGKLHGPTQPLVQWAAEQPLVDVCISRPDLESVFHALYHSQGETTE